jgi:hypothetical protein
MIRLFLLDLLMSNQIYLIYRDVNEESEGITDIIKPDIRDTKIILRHNYIIENSKLHYQIDVNPNFLDKQHEDFYPLNQSATIGSELVPQLPLSWAERIFFNLGPAH